MSDTEVAAVPRAGWYADPRDAAAARWWDGSAWTPHVRPIPASPSDAQPASSSEPAPPPPVPVPPWATVPQGAGTIGSSAPTHGLATAQVSAGPSPQTPGPTAAWGPPTTGAAWILASLPLILIAARVIGAVLDALGGGLAAILLGLISLPGAVLASLLLARRDGRQLRARGYRPPHQAWILLAPPVVYLAIRAHRVRAGGGTSRGPVVLGAISVAALWVVIGGLVIVSVSLAMQNASGRGAMYGGFDRYGNPEAGVTPTRADVERFIEDSENVRDGTRVQVSCGSGSLEPLSAFTCAGADSSGTLRSYVAKITAERTVGYAPGALDEGSDAAPPEDATPDPADVDPVPIISDRGTEAILPNGEPVAGAPDDAQIQEFASANLRSRLGWELGACTAAGATGSPQRLACIATDGGGTAHDVAVTVDPVTGHVRILRLT